MSVAQTDQLDKLRHLLDLELAQHPEFLTTTSHPTTPAIEAACCAAARANNPAALGILLDSGCFVMPGEYIFSTCTPFLIEKAYLPSPNLNIDTITEALWGKHTAIIDCLLAHNWDINMNLGHTFGDALM